MRRKLKDELLFAEKDEWLYALDIESGRVHEFNRTAKVIVQLWLVPRTVQEVAAEFAAYFQLTAQEVLADVQAVEAMLAKGELLEDV